MAGPTYLDIRQSETRILQDQLNSTAITLMDSTLASINNELTPNGRLIAQATPSLVVTVGAGLLVNPNTSKNRIINTINGVSVNFAGGTITFPSTSGNITVSPGSSVPITIGANQFVAVLVQLDSSGNLDLIVGTPVGSIGAVVVPTASITKLSFGYIIAETNGSSVIQNITNAMLYQYTTLPVGTVGTTKAYPNFFLSPLGNGDGTTFTQALAALPVSGGVILLMDSITISSGVILPNNVKILGRNQNASIFIATGGFIQFDGNYIQLQDLNFNSSGGAVGQTYVLASGNRFVISNCSFQTANNTDNQLYIDVSGSSGVGASDGVIRECSFSGILAGGNNTGINEQVEYASGLVIDSPIWLD